MEEVKSERTHLQVLVLVEGHVSVAWALRQGDSVVVHQGGVVAGEEGLVPVEVFDVAEAVGHAFQHVASVELLMLEVIELAAEVLRDVKLLHVKPERKDLTDVVVEGVQAVVLHEVVHLVFLVQVGLDEVAGVVGVDHVVVVVAGTSGGETCCC